MRILLHLYSLSVESLYAEKPPNNYEGWFFGIAYFSRIVHNKSMDSISMNSITSIVVAVISALGGIIGAYLAVQKGEKEREIKDAQREQRQADRLDSIDEKMARMEKKIDEHNGYGKKFGEVATSIAILAKDVEYLKSR